MTTVIRGTDDSASTPALTGTDADTGIFFPAANTMAMSTGGSERVRVDSSGNVGIGTSSPPSGSRLAVVGGGIQLSGGTTSQEGIRIQRASGYASISGINNDNNAYNPIAFFTSGTEAARIDSSGNLLVGTTSTTGNNERLNVTRGGSSLRIAHFENTRNLSGDENLRTVLGSNCNNTSSYQFIGSITGTGDVIYIYGNGNIQNLNNSYGSLSDAKLKENIVDATPKLDDLMQVRVRNYNLIGSQQKQIGVVAQELEQVFPGLVDESRDKDAEGNDLGTVTKGVKYSVFVPMLVKAIQELKAINDAQAQTIESLTTRIAALEAKG